MKKTKNLKKRILKQHLIKLNKLYIMKYTEYEMQDYYEEFDKWLKELCK